MSDSEQESGVVQGGNVAGTAVASRVDGDQIADTREVSATGEASAVPCVVLPPRQRLRGRWNGERISERHRAAIQTHALLRRLNKISKGKVSGTPAHLAVQVQAAKVLLAKSLPDIQSVMISGNGDAPLIILTRME